MEGFGAAMHHENGVQDIAPTAIGVENNFDPIGVGAEGLLQEGGRANAVFGLAARRAQL